jgi:hypothetical protein
MSNAPNNNNRVRGTGRGRINLWGVILAALAGGLALVTLFSLEPPEVLTPEVNSAVVGAGRTLIQLVSVTAALAVITGTINLFSVQVRGVRKMPNGIYSLLTVVTFLVVVCLHLAERVGVFKIEGVSASLRLMDVLQVAIESALAGLLFFFLTFAAFRMMRRRVTVWNVAFIATVAVVLMGYNGTDLLANLRAWLLNVPASAGMRGLLIGVAIGTVAIGVRVLVGGDRTFRE